MPLNPRTLKARSEPVRSALMGRRLRIPLPREIDWRIGARVYFSPKHDAYGSFGVAFTKRPGRVYKGRLLSARIQRDRFRPRAIVRRKPAPKRP